MVVLGNWLGGKLAKSSELQCNTAPTRGAGRQLKRVRNASCDVLGFILKFALYTPEYVMNDDDDDNFTNIV